MLRLCASGPFRRLLLIGVAGVVVTAAVSRGDAAATGVRPWNVVWLRENDGLSVWTSQRRQTFLLTGTKKKGPGDYLAAWSPDGQMIASGALDKTVQVWEGTTGKLLYTYTGHTGGINELAWSPDRRVIASTSNMVHIWGIPS